MSSRTSHLPVPPDLYDMLLLWLLLENNPAEVRTSALNATCGTEVQKYGHNFGMVRRITICAYLIVGHR